MAKKPPEFDGDVGDMVELESKCPNTVRFFRELFTTGSPEEKDALNHVQEHMDMESTLLLALENRVPAGMILMILSELLVPEFKDGLRMFRFEPTDELKHKYVRLFVKKYFSEVKGVEFEYKEPEGE